MKDYKDKVSERIKKINKKQFKIFQLMKDIITKSNSQNDRLKELGGKLLASNLIFI